MSTRRTAAAPVRVSLSMMNFPIPEEMLSKSYRPTAVLLEGKFHSLYQNKLAPEFLQYLDSSAAEKIFERHGFIVRK